MNGTRNGKIARLPRVVRQELNRRLDDGEQGKKLVVWLNALSEVQAIVAAEFGGKAIREQNLSEWKQRGYRDWLVQQETLEIVERLGEDAAEWDTEGRAKLTDTLAHWLVARYAAATRRMAETGGREGWRLLREMCGDIVELRKGYHSAERLQIERVLRPGDAPTGTPSGVTIQGMTISNGLVQGGTFPADGGGGIYNDHSTLTV